jgi:hypothetical protein
VRRPILVAVAIVAFLAVSVLVARWLNDDTVERARVVELLRAQTRGDAAAMLRVVHCPDAPCAAVVRANARRLRAPGDVKIALYQSQTAHALRSRTKPTRVVWFTPGRLTTVQCMLVRRTGNVFDGLSVTLLRISPPIGRESSCP